MPSAAYQISLSTSPTDPIVEAERWLVQLSEERANYMSRLEVELKQAETDRQALDKRIGDLRRTIARLTLASPDDEQLAASLDPDLDLTTATPTEAVEMGLLAFDNGATASAIQHWIRARGKVIKPKVIHTYLSRMLQDHRASAFQDPISKRRVYLPGPKLRGMKEEDMPSD